MVSICPTITATSLDEYQKQLYEVAPFATRLHIDVADGVFAPVKLVPPQNVQWPRSIPADIHVMYQKPMTIIETLIGLQPQLIIVPVESEGVSDVIKSLKGSDIKCGLSIQQETPVDALQSYIEQIDHVLIFSGNLGHFGGSADLSLLTKVNSILKWNGSLEISWDGGINADNVHNLVLGGVSVLNVGGAIHKTNNPKSAYDELKKKSEVSNAS